MTLTHLHIFPTHTPLILATQTLSLAIYDGYHALNEAHDEKRANNYAGDDLVGERVFGVVRFDPGIGWSDEGWMMVGVGVHITGVSV